MFFGMKTWIVTGGIASGKTLFSQMLKRALPSAVLFSSDQVVSGLLREREVIQILKQAYGPDILTESGEISRSAMRQIVFDNEKRRQELEAILHPRVYAALECLQSELAAGRNTELLIAEVPLFYESRGEFPSALVIVVATGATLQQERLTGPRSLDPDTAERIRAAQWPLTRKLDPADKVVWNEGSLTLLDLQAQLLAKQLDNS